MKILIIGYSGGGKSTLAQLLSDHYRIPKLHLDQLFFKPNWQPRPEQDFLSDLNDFLNSNQAWVIDGVYSRYLFEERLKMADQIIFLNFNRLSAFGRILKRFMTHHGKIRPSAPAGCKENLDWDFIKFVLFTSRSSRRKAMYKQIEQKYHDKMIVLHSQKEIDEFIRNLK